LLGEFRVISSWIEEGTKISYEIQMKSCLVSSGAPPELRRAPKMSYGTEEESWLVSSGGPPAMRWAPKFHMKFR